MTRNGELVVVGGGVVGLACALNLQRAGARVLLLDEPHSTLSASWGNAGHIAIEQVEPIASPKALAAAPGRLFWRGGALDFRLADVGAWGPWALRYLRASQPRPYAQGCAALLGLLAEAMPAWRRLVQSVGRPELLLEDGHLVVWESPRSAATGKSAWSAAQIGEARFRDLDPPALDALSAKLRTPVAGGLRFENTGQIADLGEMLNALRAALIAEGGAIRAVHVARLAIEAGQAHLVLTDGERLDPEQIVIAAGTGSGPLMRGAGHAAPLIAERGYHIEGRLDGDAWGASPPVVFEDRSMIVTRFAGRLRCASFVEFGRAASPPDPRKWARLERHAAQLGLPMGAPVSRWMGARPTLPDYLPALGRSRRAANLAYAFGHQHLGLTLAATTGEILASVLSGDRAAIDLAPFDIERFTHREAAS